MCRCCAKGEHVRDTFPSLPPASFPRGYSFAFNCERDWSQPCVSSLCSVLPEMRTSRDASGWFHVRLLDMPNVNSQFNNCSFVASPFSGYKVNPDEKFHKYHTNGNSRSFSGKLIHRIVYLSNMLSNAITLIFLLLMSLVQSRFTKILGNKYIRVRIHR